MSARRKKSATGVAEPKTALQAIGLTDQPQRMGREEVQRLRAVAAPPPRQIKRVFFLDSPLGEVQVTVKGPAKAARLQATHDSLVISTGETVPTVGTVGRRPAAPPRQMSGNPKEPSGTIEANLPGDDAVVEDGVQQFFRQMEKAEMKKVAEE